MKKLIFLAKFTYRKKRICQILQIDLVYCEKNNPIKNELNSIAKSAARRVSVSETICQKYLLESKIKKIA